MVKKTKNLINFFSLNPFLVIFIVSTIITIALFVAYVYYSKNVHNTAADPIVAKYVPPETSLNKKVTFQSVVKKENIPQIVHVPILMYHYLELNKDKKDTLRTSLSVTPYYFEKQIQTLISSGYSIISFRELEKAIKGEDKLPDKSIILTFDDGYKDFYTDAFPILKKYNVKATNFIITGHIGRSGNLSKEEIAELIQSGIITIGAHTVHHYSLVSLSEKDAESEIVESKKYLEDNFQIKVYDFAYPYGFLNDKVEKLVAKAGYETGSATTLGATHDQSRLFKLSRIRVGNYAEKALLNRIENVK